MTTDDAPGWDAIVSALERTYGETVPMHFGTAVKWSLGGPDPLDGLSAYPRTDPAPHWHIVSFGMSELYEKVSDVPERSGWGFELTFRPARAADEPQPPAWSLNLMQNLGRYVFQYGNSFAAGDHTDLGGPIALDHPESPIVAAGFATDPELPAIDTPHGSLEFLQIVGLTADEYDAAREWRTDGVLDLLAGRNPLLATDPRPAASACTLTVRIFSEPSNSSTPVGICAQGDPVVIHATANGDEMECGSTVWDNVTDTANNVTGWISACYIG